MNAIRSSQSSGSKSISKSALSMLLGLVSLVHSTPALACAVCFSAKNEASRTAFIITTAVLTLLPLLLIGWGVRWVVRRERQRNAEDAVTLSSASFGENVESQGQSSFPSSAPASAEA